MRIFLLRPEWQDVVASQATLQNASANFQIAVPAEPQLCRSKSGGFYPVHNDIKRQQQQLQINYQRGCVGMDVEEQAEWKCEIQTPPRASAESASHSPSCFPAATAAAGRACTVRYIPMKYRNFVARMRRLVRGSAQLPPACARPADPAGPLHIDVRPAAGGHGRPHTAAIAGHSGP